ncbi:hypothetical protein FHG87_021812 [Trinorchestia longiramus]|nr:hypothetical protein FHG87_021812 [Trinorchestia longiramus]
MDYNTRKRKLASKSHILQLQLLQSRYNLYSTSRSPKQTDFEQPCLKTLWTFPNWCCCCFQQPQPLLCTTPTSGIGSCSTPTPHTKWTLFVSLQTLSCWAVSVTMTSHDTIYPYDST